jgi:hypothetical protein
MFFSDLLPKTLHNSMSHAIRNNKMAPPAPFLPPPRPITARIHPSALHMAHMQVSTFTEDVTWRSFNKRR